MTMRRVLFLALALALLLGCTTVLAQEDDAEVTDEPMDDGAGDDDDTVEVEDDEEVRPRDPNAHPLTDIPPAASDVVTSFVFPNLTEPVFTPGDKVSILAGFTSADREYNVTHIMGSFNHPQDLTVFVYNFSYKMVGMTTKPNAQYTFEYEMTAPAWMEEQSFVLATTVFYQDTEADEEGAAPQQFASTFYNGTIEIAAAPSDFGGQQAFQTVLGIGIVVLIFQIFCSSDQGSGTSRNNSAAFNADWTDAIRTAKSPGSPRSSSGKRSSSNKRK